MRTICYMRIWEFMPAKESKVEDQDLQREKENHQNISEKLARLRQRTIEERIWDSNEAKLVAIFKELKNIKMTKQLIQESGTPVRTGGAAVVVRTMSGDERKEWKGFLADVDEDGVEEYEVEALLSLFELNKLRRPSILVFLHQEADVVSLQSYGELQPSEKKLLKKTVSMATTVTELKKILENHFQG